MVAQEDLKGQCTDSLGRLHEEEQESLVHASNAIIYDEYNYLNKAYIALSQASKSGENLSNIKRSMQHRHELLNIITQNITLYV